MVKSTFIPDNFAPAGWDGIEPLVNQLLERPLPDQAALEQWLGDYSELYAAVYEFRAWRFIRMTCNTQDEKAAAEWQQLVSDILPPFTAAIDSLLRHLHASPAFENLSGEEWVVMKRLVNNTLELYKEENIPLQQEINTQSREFDTLAASLDVEVDGERVPIARATRWLELKDRSQRQLVWTRIIERRLQEKDKLNDLFTRLIQLRTQVAHNAGFQSFTDYAFPMLGRFDYDRSDTLRFHDSVEKIMRPAYEQLMEARRRKLGLEELTPADLMVELWGEGPLNPFSSAQELVQKTGELLAHLHPRLAPLMDLLRDHNLLDLEARLGKAPGGYSYSLPRTGLPFVFMNAAGSLLDLTTMVHEMGHAIQSWLMAPSRLFIHRHLPSEIAELASMSLELIALDHMNLFFPDVNDYKRARREQLMRVFTLMPWIASIDCFQQWVYDNPNHTEAERGEAWVRVYTRFHGDTVKWPLPGAQAHFWQKQGHLFDAPFYYIEYGIAQLGAVAMWRNYRRDPAACMDQYLNALAMGYSRPIPEVYAAAGISFDFSEQYIKELMEFLLAEIARLDA